MAIISLTVPSKNISLLSAGFSGFRSVAYVSGPTGPSGDNGLDASGIDRIHGIFPILYTSGDQSISIDMEYISGVATSGFNTGALNNYLSLSATGQFYAASNPSGFINNLSGLSIGYVTGISGNLQLQINGLATSLNLALTGQDLYNLTAGLSGQINLNFATISNLQSTGQQVLDVANNNSINLSGNIFLTGNLLNNRIDSLSGYSLSKVEANSLYYLSSNPSGFITGVSIGNFVTRQETGQFYSVSNPLQFATSGDIITTGQQVWSVANNNSINLSGNLFVTGSTLDSKINSLSGFVLSTTGVQQSISGLITTGQADTRYYSINNPSGFITGINTGNFLSRQETGQFYAVNNPLQFANSGNLFNTGSLLDQKINSLSGNNYYQSYNPSGFVDNLSGLSTGYILNLSGSLLSQINNTGSLLFNLINLSSGLLSTGIYQTGSLLIDKINLLSGLISSPVVIYHNNLSGLQGGVSGEYYHLSQSQSIDWVGLSTVIGISGVLQFAINNASGGGSTGNYYSNNNPSGYITGFNSGLYATKADLTNSGILLQDYFGVNNQSMEIGFDPSGTTTGLFYANGVNVMLYRNISGSITGIYSNRGKLKIVLRNANNKATGIRYT